MLAPWLLATLCFLYLPVYATSHPHGVGSVHERHVARAARVSKPKHLLTKRNGPVRCPAKVPGAKLLQTSPVVLGASQISLVLAKAATASYSWEVGTYQTALLELYAPELFLYNGTKTIPPTLTSDSDVTELFASVDAVLAQQPSGILPFFSDKAVGDPASVGIAVLIRNWTYTGSGGSKYGTAAKQQLNYLLNDVDRASNGAISQRAPPAAVQLWADFMAMAPPFIGYYGAVTNNRDTVEEAYQQLAAYHETLYDSDVGMLKHILLGATSVQDHNHWATGNGWAVTGMLRVLRIIQLSNFASSMQSEQADLLSWTTTIISNVWKHQQSSGALLNYIDLDPSETFEDAAGTALLAAGTFRLAALVFGTSNAPYVNVAAAEKGREWVNSQIGSDGWLTNTVDPYNWHQAASPAQSPEGQSFILMLQAAYRDWYATTQGYY